MFFLKKKRVGFNEVFTFWGCRGFVEKCDFLETVEMREKVVGLVLYRTVVGISKCKLIK
jgi:hypothetical protein